MDTINITGTDIPQPLSYEPEQLAQLTDPQVGGLAVALVRSKWRLARIVKIGRVNAKVICTSPSALAQAQDWAATHSAVDRLTREIATTEQYGVKYARMAELIEQYLADGTISHDAINAAEYQPGVPLIHTPYDSLPAPLRAVVGEPRNLSRTEMLKPPSYYRELAEGQAATAASQRERMADAQAWDALSYDEKLVSFLTTTEKTVKLAELKAAPVNINQEVAA